MAVTITPGKSNLPLFENYMEWNSLSNDEREELYHELKSSASRLWLTVCRRAVESMDVDWLRTFADPEIPDYLPWPFNGWSPADRLNKKKYLAISLANCGLAAIERKRNRGAYSSEFGPLVLKAVYFRRKAIDASASPPTIGACSSVDDVFQNLAGSDVDSESIEVKLLIDYLTSPTDLWADIKEVARTRFPVVIGNTHGRVCELRVRRIRNGSGRLFCDSFEMSMTPIDRKFRIALGNALTLVRKQYGINRNIDFCWSIYDSSGQLAGFDGPSIGLAAAMAFRQVATSKPGRLRFLLRRIREKFLDSYTAYTGEIDAITGSVNPVGGYIEKLEAMDRIYTLFVPEADFSKLASFRADGRKIRPARSLVQVADESRSILFKRIRLVLGVVSVALVLPLITVAAVYWGHVQSLAAAAAEDRAIAEQKEKRNSELEAQNLKRENAAKELQAQNAKTDRDLAIREKNVANQQSAILSEKNKQLDIARRNEESQRKLAEKNENEAKFQRSVAEKNEETARAFEQVAKANQLAYQGLSFLNDKDYVSAQTYFAQSLSYNDTLLARSGLVNATYRSPLPQEFNWSLDQRMTSSNSAIGVGAETFFYRFTSDSTGEYFAYLSDETEISLRKVQSKEEIAKVVADGKKIDAISLSPGGKFLAIGTSEGDVFLRDVLSQKQEKILTLDKAKTRQDGPTVTALAFSSDSTYLALATANPQIVVIDVRKRTIVNSFPKMGTGADDLGLENDTILNLVFNSSAGLAFSTIDEDLNSEIGFIPNVQKDTALTASSKRLVTNISFTNDQEIISSGMGWETWLANGESIKRDKSEDFTARIQTLVAANRHFDYFISAGEDGRLKIWNSSDKRLIAQISPSIGKPIHATIGDNGAVLMQSVTGNGKLRIFCWRFGQKVNNHQIPAEAVTAKEFVSYTGNYVKFDCSKRFLQVQNYFTGKTLLSVQYNTSKDLNQLIITPRLSRDGTHLLVKRVEVRGLGAASSTEEKLAVYDLSSLQSTEIDLSKYRGPTFPNTWHDFCFEDGRSGPQLVTGTPRAILGSDNEEYISDDGKTIAARIRDNAVGVFSVNGHKAPIAVIPNNVRSKTPVPIGDRLPSSFSISSNSRILVTSVPTVLDMIENKKDKYDFPANGYYSFQLYDIQTGELKEQIPSPETLSGYSLSPDGRFFAVTDLEGYVAIWTLAPYLRLLDVLKVGKYERALSPSFSQDSSMLAWISGGTGRIHFYDLRAQGRLGDLQTDDFVIEIGFVDTNKLSIYTADELRSVDLNNLPMILALNALDSKRYIHALNNLYLDDVLVTGFLYDQPRLDSILKASKYSIVSPSVRGRAKHSDEITEFDREGIAISQGVQARNRQGAFDCNPIFSQPIFNPYPITFNDDRPAPCGHYPLIDIRNASRGEKYSKSQKAWESFRQVKPGEVYNGLIYMSNGAAEDLDEATVYDVRARVTINYGQTGNNFIKGELLADNAMLIDAALPLDTSRMRPVVGNKIEIYDYQDKLLKTIDISDFLHLEGGHKVSFEIPIGDLKPGFTTDLFIRFKFFFEDASRLPDQRVDKYTGIITDGDITKLERNFSKSNIGCSPRSSSAVFNPFRVSFNDSNEECTDFPLIQGRLIGGTYPQNVQELGDGLTGHDGDIVEMLIYFDNGASEGLDRQKNAINGFKVTVTVDTLPSPTHTVTAILRADNAPSLSRSIAIHTDASEQLEIIPKSGVLYDFQKNPVQSGFDVGNTLISMQDLLPGFGHSGFIRFRIKIVSKDTRVVASCDRAVMSGSVQIGDPETSAWFEWGETRELGKLTAKKLFNENAEDSQEITGLAPNTTYYYRAVARSGNRRAAGEIRSFRTPECTK
jgi:WD40 repeat protein